MKEQVKKKWVKALRSGEYEQCKFLMHDEFGFCCLGVLNAIAPASASHSDAESVSLKVLEWAGLEMADMVELARLNDSGATFDQIAYCIERGL